MKDSIKIMGLCFFCRQEVYSIEMAQEYEEHYKTMHSFEEFIDILSKDGGPVWHKSCQTSAMKEVFEELEQFVSSNGDFEGVHVKSIKDDDDDE